MAYGRIPRAGRAEKHRQAADKWIRPSTRPEDHAGRHARDHYQQALEYAYASGTPSAALDERARLALSEAGDRATALKGYQAAARFYTAALELWPEDDPEWPAMLFRYGKAVFYAEEAGVKPLTEARDALLLSGDLATAAEAEIMLGRLAFRAGDGAASNKHYAQARQLLQGAPASPSKAWVQLTRSRARCRSEERRGADGRLRGS